MSELLNDDSTAYAIERQSLAEQVYHYIKRLILSGKLKGGEKIPEEKIAQQFALAAPLFEKLYAAWKNMGWSI